jgi:hypothetical protein
LIDKFSKWEKKATSRGDMFTKELGRAPAWTDSMGAYLKFEFHSGNANAHYLAIIWCSSGLCLEEKAVLFTKSNAKKLRELLIKFQSGQLKNLDGDAVYQ